MTKSALAELDKVRLVPASAAHDSDSGHDSDSDPESDVTIPSEIDENELYAVDAIKWAWYKDSRRVRPDGFEGWHYGVMWKGYLKTISDTEEPFDAFTEEDGQAPLVSEFWKAVGKDIPVGRKEPGGKLGEIHEAPKETLKLWFKNAKPRRDYETYKRRRDKELAGLPPTKADSDYYWRKKRKARNAARRAPTAGPSKQKTKGKASGPESTPRKGQKDPETRASRTDSLDSIFDEVPSIPEARPAAVKAPKRIRAGSSDQEAAAPEAKVEKKKRKTKTATTKNKTDLPKDSSHGAQKEKATSKGKDAVRVKEKPREDPTSRGFTKSDQDSTAFQPAPPHPAVSLPATTSSSSSRIPTAIPSAAAAADKLDEQPTTSAQQPPAVSGPAFGAPDPSILGDSAISSSAVARQPLFDVSPDSSPETRVAITAGGSPKQLSLPSPMASKTVEDDAAQTVKLERQEPIPDTAAATNRRSLPDDAEVIVIPDSPDDYQASHKSDKDADLEDMEIIEIDIDVPPAPAPTSAAPERETSHEGQSSTSLPAAATTSSSAEHTATFANAQNSQLKSPVMSTRPVASGSTTNVYNSSAPSTSLSDTNGQKAATSAEPVDSVPAEKVTPAPLATAPVHQEQVAPELQKQVAPATTEQILPEPTEQVAPVPTLKLPPNQRPKYVQPKRIKQIDIAPDPARDPSARTLGPDGRPRGALAHPPPAAPITGYTAANTITPGPARPASARRASVSHPHAQAASAPTTTPAQPPNVMPTAAQAAAGGVPRPMRRWGNVRPQYPAQAGSAVPPNPYGAGPSQSPYGAGPSQSPYGAGQSSAAGHVSPNHYYGRPPAQAGRPPYGAGGRSPYGADGRSPHAAGGRSPYGAGGRSPYAPGGRSPRDIVGGMSPVAGFMPLTDGGRSPATMSSAIGQRIDHISPTYGQNESGPTPEGPQTQAVYEATRDPRRRPRPPEPAPTAVVGPPEAGAAGTSTTSAQELRGGEEAPTRVIGHFLAHFPHVRRGDIEGIKISMDLRHSHISTSNHRFLSELGDIQPEHGFMFQNVDKFCLNMLLAQGAVISEWSQVVPSGGLENNRLSDLMHKDMMWACGDELTPLGGGLVTSHHLLLIMSLKDANFSADERARLGLGTSEGLIAIIISAPLVGRPIPQLPNPVQPDFVTGERALDSPDPPPISGARTVAESYGFNQVAERNLSGKTVIILPKDASMTSVYAQVVNQCVKSGVHAPPKNGEPKVLVIFNGYWLAVAQSGTLQRSLDRPVRFYAMGPDLQSPISSWTCKPIWETGGLVTFSPTFILRQPTKFQEIMEMIRETPNWAAYITPSSILWFEQSWKIPNRCPDPSKSFAALVAELYFDDHVRQMARSGGGLAVSTVPPQLQRRERCADWLNWLRCVWQCEEWADLVKRCEEYQQRYLQSRVDKDMVLVDVERLGLEDLAGMRIRPHLVPYRRYLYVGQVSLKPQDKAKLGQAVEMISADDFVAVLSGAV